jgi:hypothetical protein
MSHKSIQPKVLAQVLQSLGDTFHTRDVSDDARVHAAHSELTGHPQFNVFIGKALELNHIQLAIAQTGKKTARGVEWAKQRRSASDGKD